MPYSTDSDHSSTTTTNNATDWARESQIPEIRVNSDTPPPIMMTKVDVDAMNGMRQDLTELSERLDKINLAIEHLMMQQPTPTYMVPQPPPSHSFPHFPYHSFPYVQPQPLLPQPPPQQQQQQQPPPQQPQHSTANPPPTYASVSKTSPRYLSSTPPPPPKINNSSSGGNPLLTLSLYDTYAYILGDKEKYGKVVGTKRVTSTRIENDFKVTLTVPPKNVVDSKHILITGNNFYNVLNACREVMYVMF